MGLKLQKDLEGGSRGFKKLFIEVMYLLGGRARVTRHLFVSRSNILFIFVL